MENEKLEAAFKRSPLSSTMIFSRDGVKFHDSGGDSERRNNHDHAQGVDVTIRDEYIRNGINNYLPFRIVGAVKRSTTQKRAFTTITNIAAGTLNFVNSDNSPVSELRLRELREKYKEIGINYKDFLYPSVCSAYLHGGVPVTMTWDSNGREFKLSKIQARDYKSFRLGAADMLDGRKFHNRHYYHRTWGWNEERKSRRIKVSKKDKSWLEYKRAQKKNKKKVADSVVWINSYNPERKMTPVNRTQSYFIRNTDGLSDYYPLPPWFSGAAFNYVKADFLLSCFDVDDIQNGFHASGFVKVYHKSYKNPESGEAISTFEDHKKQVETRFRGAYNSGAIAIMPVAIDGSPTSDFMEFVPTPTTSNKDRHNVLDVRVEKNILAANGGIYPEIFSLPNTKNSLSEGDGKLPIGLKILNQFTIKPLLKMFDDPESGFLNIVNDILGIEERAVITPNLSAFLDLSEGLLTHFLHPEQVYQMYSDFGMTPPTQEQIESELIPAYRKEAFNTKNKNDE